MVMRATKYSTLAPDYPTLAQIVRKLGACGLSVGMVACIIGAVGGSTLLAIPSFGLSATAGAAVVGVCGAAGLAALNDCLAQCSLTSCQVAPGPVERFGDRIRTCKRDRL